MLELMTFCTLFFWNLKLFCCFCWKLQRTATGWKYSETKTQGFVFSVTPVCPFLLLFYFSFLPLKVLPTLAFHLVNLPRPTWIVCWTNENEIWLNRSFPAKLHPNLNRCRSFLFCSILTVLKFGKSLNLMFAV